MVHNICPYEISPSKTKRVVDLHALSCDLEQLVITKVINVKDEKNKLSKKLING
jgi:hypothetical protein